MIKSTNKPWEIDPAILRRFQRKIYCPLPDLQSRIQLFEINLQEFYSFSEPDKLLLSNLTDGW